MTVRPRHRAVNKRCAGCKRSKYIQSWEVLPKKTRKKFSRTAMEVTIDTQMASMFSRIRILCTKHQTNTHRRSVTRKMSSTRHETTVSFEIRKQSKKSFQKNRKVPIPEMQEDTLSWVTKNASYRVAWPRSQKKSCIVNSRFTKFAGCTPN